MVYYSLGMSGEVEAFMDRVAWRVVGGGGGHRG